MKHISLRFWCFLSSFLSHLHHNSELQVTRRRPCFAIINPTTVVSSTLHFPIRGRTRGTRTCLISFDFLPGSIYYIPNRGHGSLPNCGTYLDLLGAIRWTLGPGFFPQCHFFFRWAISSFSTSPLPAAVLVI